MTIKYLIAVLLSAFLIHQFAPKQALLFINKPIRASFSGVIQALEPVSVKEQTATTIQVAGACAQYRPLLAQYGWNVNVMYGVMQAESHCNPNANNHGVGNYDGIPDYGLMQLHGQAIYDPVQNVAAAYRLWKVQGYRAWTTYTSGLYLAYL